MTLTALHARQTLHHEAIDWASRVVSNGGTASMRTIRAVSRFCSEIQAAGIRDRFHRLNLFCGTGLSSVLVPLYRGQSFGGTTFGGTTDTNVNFVAGDYAETSGLTGNGSTKYLNTGFPANTIAAGSAHLGIGILAANTLTSARTGIGAYNGSTLSFEIAMRNGFASAPCCYFTRFNTASDRFGDDVGTGAATLAAGNIVASWPTMYRNGAASGTTATTSQNYSAAHSFFVFANNNAGGGVISYTDARFGWYSIGSTMTGTQVTAFNAALTRFYTALGRS